MEVINLEQGSQEWLDFRKTKIGASELAYLFNANPFCKATDQMKYLIGLKLGFNEIFYNSAMRAGHDNESDIIEYVEKEYDIVTQPLVGYKENLVASYDGITFDNDIVVEVKFSKHTYDYILKHNDAPEHYYLQVQQQLFVSGAEKAIFAAMHSETREVAMCEIYPHQDVHKEIMSKVEDFYILLESKKWKEDDFNEERNDEEWIKAVDNYRIAKLNEDEIKKKVNEAKERLIKLSSGIRSKGAGCTVYPTKGRETVDYKSIIKDNNLSIDDKYKKVVASSWIVRLSNA